MKYMVKQRRRFACLVLVATALFSTTPSTTHAFVNLKPVRNQQLQSTSTPTTYEPAHVLTDAYARNPFESLKQECVGSSGSDDKSWFSQLSRNPALLARYYQSESYRQQMQNNMKISLHHFLRDSGALRSIMDFLVTIGTPSLAMDHPEIVPTFWKLTQDCMRIPYGGHKLQGVDLYLPENEAKPKGLLYFVHGGAWGSGLPWMYRLVAQPFLEKGMAVAVVGYRTFPDGDIRTQVEDLELAAKELAKRFPEFCVDETEFGVCAMGHSSGAHILMQMMVDRVQRKLQGGSNNATEASMRIDTFVGMSAPYEIASHYEFETMRGVEELSPMKPACGNNKESLSDYSPVLQLYRTLLTQTYDERQHHLREFPRVCMLHGLCDDTVPFSSTRQASQLLRLLGIFQCEEVYFSETGHSDTVFELMFGGKTREEVMKWLDGQIPTTNIPYPQSSSPRRRHGYNSISMQKQSAAAFVACERVVTDADPVKDVKDAVKSEMATAKQ